MNIYLIGYRGSGKTTVGRLLADLLGWPFVDADETLERREGRTIAEIFAAGGEALFRKLESAVVFDLSLADNLVAALGGGAILREENREALASGVMIWLQVTPETAHQRVLADVTTSARRPNLTTRGGLEEIRALLAQRAPLYEACADFTVDANARAPAELADEIHRWLTRRPGSA